MSEAAGEGSDANLPKSVKDKACAYCGQAFTSSSLGRHLDLYIRGKNPKPPDGIHDVVAIRKLRGSITRRQPRGSSAGRTSDPTPSATPKQSLKRATPASSQKPAPPPAAPRNAQYPAAAGPAPAEVRYPFNPPQWGAPPAAPGYPYTPTPNEADRQTGTGAQRVGNKQMAQKAQLDVKQRLADAMDNARAAELALRELLGSWQAARFKIDNSTPFDFDPLVLDFPALVLQCLQPPPTLFSSTQLHNSTSWAISSPGQREFSALQAYLRQKIQDWKNTCVSPTGSTADDPSHTASQAPHQDGNDGIENPGKTAETIEQEVTEHLQNAYFVWEKLAAQKRDELWVLELARCVGRKQKEVDSIREQREKLEQVNANLKLQVDQLNRFQQPREFSILSPKVIPIDREILAYACGDSVWGPRPASTTAEDRNQDLTRVVANAIERWRNVITSTRVNTGGMNAQRPLDQPFSQHPAAPSHFGSGQQQQQQQQQQQPAPPNVAQTQQMLQQQQQQKQKQTLQHQQSLHQQQTSQQHNLQYQQPQPPSHPQQQSQQQSQQHQQQQQQQQEQKQKQKQPQKQSKSKQAPPSEPEPSSVKRHSTASSHGHSSDHTVASSAGSGAPSGDETSDQDADAEMDDDDTFVGMSQPSAKAASGTMQLDGQQARGSMAPQQPQPPPPQQQQQQQQSQSSQQQSQPPAGDMRFMVPNGGGGPANGRMAAMAAISRSMPGMNMAGMQGSAMHGSGDINMTMQGVRGDIYME